MPYKAAMEWFVIFFGTVFTIIWAAMIIVMCAIPLIVAGTFCWWLLSTKHA